MLAAPKLREDLEIIRGMDDIPMIFDPVSGRYHRISRSAEAILRYLDGTRSTEEIIALLSGNEETKVEIVRRRLTPFLGTLTDSGLLIGSNIPDVTSTRFRRSGLMPRYVLTRSLPKLLEPTAAALRHLPVTYLVVVVVLLAAGGYIAGGLALVRAEQVDQVRPGVLLVAVALQLTFILVHESAHALVAQYLRTPVRGLGVALLFYFMPVAYVDRTDAYRVRKRGGRVALAMAGVTSDGCFCGLVAVTYLNSTGFVRQTCLVLLGLQLIGLAVNLNPLLPSDGYTAIEAATGLIDARGRSMTVLRAAVTRKSLPSYLSLLPARSRALYAGYGIVCALYICVVAVGAFLALVPAVRTAIEVFA